MKVLLSLSLMCFAVLLTACTPYHDVDPHLTGWRSPAVSAPDQYGKQVSLKSATSGPWAIVFFYPQADTPG